MNFYLLLDEAEYDTCLKKGRRYWPMCIKNENTLPFLLLNHNYIVHISFSSYALWYKTWLGSQNSLSFTKSKFSTSFTYPYIPTKFEHRIFLSHLWVQIYCKAFANSTSIFSCFTYFPSEDKIPKSNCVLVAF